MNHVSAWLERTLEGVVLPAISPIADVRNAGASNCRCAHGLLSHDPAAGTCRSCACAGYHPTTPALTDPGPSRNH